MSLAKENLASIQTQRNTPRHVPNVSDMLKDGRVQLTGFLQGMINKYIPEEVKQNLDFSFYPSLHFMDRLLLDRADKITKQWFNLTITRLFRNQLCEFLYVVALTDHENSERITISYQGNTIGIVKETDPFTENGYLLKMVTVYQGKARSPDYKYNHLEVI